MATTPDPSSWSGATPTPPASGTTPACGAAPQSLPIALKVSFTMTSADGLRQINFGLEKDSDGTNVNWTITFSLFERTDNTAAFCSPLVTLNVFVATTLHANAEIAAHAGLNPAQTAHATGPAADAAKGAQQGIVPLPVANQIIQATLK